MISKEKTWCCCCRKCPGFQKILKEKNTGIVLYRYSSPVKHAIQDLNILDKADKATSDVFIVHNTTSFDIPNNAYMCKFAQYTIKCPRCRYIFERTRKLLEGKSHMNKIEVKGICEHCQDMDELITPCTHCCEVVKKFIAIKKQKAKEIEEYFMLKKLRDYLTFINVPHKLRRSLSELYLHKEQDVTWNSKLFPSPQIDQLYDSKKLRQSYTQFYRKSESHLENEENLIHVSGFPTKRYLSRESIKMIKKSDIDFDVWQENEVTYPHIKSSLDALCKQYKLYTPRKYANSISENDLYYDPLKSIYLKNSHLHKATKSLKLEKKEDDEFKDIVLGKPNLYQHVKKLDVDKLYFHDDFSFVFMKKSDEKLDQPKDFKSSSKLIKDTQNIIREREEKKKSLFDKEMRSQEKKNQFVKSFGSINKNKVRMSTATVKKTVSKKTEKIINENPAKKLKQEIINENIHSEVIKDKAIIKRLTVKKEDDTDELQGKEQTQLTPQKIRENILKNKTLQKRNEKDLSEKNENLRYKKEQIQDAEKVDQRDSGRGTKKQKIEKPKKGNEETYLDELKKMMAENKKQKEEELKLKKKQEEEKITKQNEWTEDKNKHTTESKKKEETKLNVKSKLKFQAKDKQNSESKLKINQVIIHKPSDDDLILQLVKLKQSGAPKTRMRPKRLSEININPEIITAHKGHKYKKLPNCVICNDSELELDIENIIMGKSKNKEAGDVIIGEKILKYRPINQKKKDEKYVIPIFFTSNYQDDVLEIPMRDARGDEEDNVKTRKIGEQEIPKGVIRYALSDRTFIDKGWTMLPTEKVVRKMNVYRMRPAHPEFDWFEHNKDKKLIHYDSGEKLAEFDDNGKGRWFYRNGKLALDYYNAEEINAQQRFVIYSNGEPDERGRSRPLVILATFDYLGNGIVFDHAGKIRLKYNQTEGVVLDRSLGPVSHWKWHTLNDPPVLQQIMIDTQMAHKDPEIFKLGGPADDKQKTDNEEMLAIEFDNFIKEKSKKLSQKFKPFQIKMKALKINEHFSLKVLDQATVYLIFRDGSTNLKINIGMILDHKEIVDTDTAEVGEVCNSLERFPARTDSLAGLQKSVAYAQRVERARMERERRLQPPRPFSSSDRINAVISRPLRPPFRTVPHSCSETSTDYNCKCRKPSSFNLYYDTRFP